MSTRGPVSAPLTRARCQSTSVELSVTGPPSRDHRTSCWEHLFELGALDAVDLPDRVHVDQDVASMQRRICFKVLRVASSDVSTVSLLSPRGIFWCITAAGGRGRLQCLRSNTRGCQPQGARCRRMECSDGEEGVTSGRPHEHPLLASAHINH